VVYLENKNSSDMKQFFGKNTGQKCSICGSQLKGHFYSNKPLCYKCWKNQLTKRNSIKDVMSRLGENSIAGKKSWIDLQRQQEKQYTNYCKSKPKIIEVKKITNQFACSCGNKSFSFDDINQEYVCKLCSKCYKKKGALE
jgi:hypothetical protein